MSQIWQVNTLWQSQIYTPIQCHCSVSTLQNPIAWKRFLQLPRYKPGKILQVKVITARSKIKSRLHNDVALVAIPNECLPSISFLYLMVLVLDRPPDHPDTMGENNTLTALKGCGIINLYWFIWLLVAYGYWFIAKTVNRF